LEGPLQVNEDTRQPQDLTRTFRDPVPLAPVECPQLDPVGATKILQRAQRVFIQVQLARLKLRWQAIRQLDETHQRLAKFRVLLGHIISKGEIVRGAGPSKEDARVKAVLVSAKGALKFIGLQATGEADEKMLDGDGLATDALDDVCPAVPSLQPEFPLAARKSEEEARQLIDNDGKSPRPRLDQNSDLRNSGVRHPEALRDERLGFIRRHWGERFAIYLRLLHGELPVLQACLGNHLLLFVGTSRLRHIRLACAFNCSERASRSIKPRRFALARRRDDRAPHA